MRRPYRSRKIALILFAMGVAAAAALLLLPIHDSTNEALPAVLIGVASIGVILGGAWAVSSHLAARSSEALRRGEDVIARWRVGTEVWKTFFEYDRRLQSESQVRVNELSEREGAQNEVEVIVGKAGIQVGQSIFRLPPRRVPEVTSSTFNVSPGGQAYVQLELFYPGNGRNRPVATALRIPVPRGAEWQADLVVAHYAGNRGDPDFFHGRGDGTDPEDLSRCYACGYETHKYVSRCPQCGAGMQSRRWARRFGGCLVLCGLFLTGLIGVVLYHVAPALLRAGTEVNGARFSGTPMQAAGVTAILGAVMAFGLGTLSYGIYQVRTGRRNKKVVRIAAWLLILLWLVSALAAFLR